MRGQVTDLAGRNFGQLTVLSQFEVRRTKGRGRTYWLCACAVCGREKWMMAQVLNAGAQSCGCLPRGKVKHGHAPQGNHSPEYRAWHSMKRRCLNSNGPHFNLWGGRGIKVCAKWADSFEQFLADMGSKPPGKSLDRYPDRDGHYEPGNCRWATRVEQNQNTSRNRFFSFDGETHCVSEWARLRGISRGAMLQRLSVHLPEWALSPDFRRASA